MRPHSYARRIQHARAVRTPPRHTSPTCAHPSTDGQTDGQTVAGARNPADSPSPPPPPERPMLSASHPRGGETASNVRFACRRLAGLHPDVLCPAPLTGQSPLAPGRSWGRGQTALAEGRGSEPSPRTHVCAPARTCPPPPRRFRTAIPESHARLRAAVPRPPFLPPSPRAPSGVLRHSTRLDSVIVQTYSLLCSAAWDRTPTSCRRSAVTPSAPLLPANCRVLGGTRSIQKCRYIEQDTRLARVLRPPDLCSARSE